MRTVRVASGWIVDKKKVRDGKQWTSFCIEKRARKILVGLSTLEKQKNHNKEKKHRSQNPKGEGEEKRKQEEKRTQERKANLK